jgi:hypothetical protein
MRRLCSLLLLLSASAFATTEQCPELKGNFHCAVGAGVPNETTILIQQSKNSRWVTYWYTWEDRGEAPVEGYFVANDQGRRQDDNWSMIGKCENGFLFVAAYGDPRWDTRFVRVNANGDYEAVRHGDGRVTTCQRIR